MKKGIVYILITTLFFTTLEPVAKLIAADINPLALTFFRFFIGGLVLLPFSIVAIKKTGVCLQFKDYRNFVLMGVLLICISMVLLQTAVLKADSPALIAIILSSSSVFTILFGVVLLKDKITVIKGIAVVLCLAGVLLCADFSSGTNLLSVALGFCSALSFSLYTVLSKRLMKNMVGIIQTGFSFIAGSLVLLVILLCLRIPLIGSISIHNYGQLLYLGFVVTGAGYWFYFKSIEKASALGASMVFFIKPVLTPLATFFINGIVPSITIYLALILVVSGSYLVTRQNS